MHNNDKVWYVNVTLRTFTGTYLGFDNIAEDFLRIQGPA